MEGEAEGEEEEDDDLDEEEGDYGLLGSVKVSVCCLLACFVSVSDGRCCFSCGCRSVCCLYSLFVEACVFVVESVLFCTQ